MYEAPFNRNKHLRISFLRRRSTLKATQILLQSLFREKKHILFEWKYTTVERLKLNVNLTTINDISQL